MNRTALGAIVAFAATSIAHGQIMVMDFEGLDDFETIDSFYDGGTGGLGSGPGPDFGVVFSTSGQVLAQALIDFDAGGSGLFDNAPTPDTILFFQALEPVATIVMDVADGFDTGFSFFYTSVDTVAEVTVYSEVGGGGTELGSIALPALGGSFDIWAAVGLAFAGVARSVEFTGITGLIGFDNITLGSEMPIIVPLPAPLLMGALGLGVLAFGRKRLKRLAAA